MPVNKTLKAPKTTERYKLVDSYSGKVIDQSNVNSFSTANKIVAQHYKYVRCTKRALSDAFKLMGGSKSKVLRWMLNHSNHVNNNIPYSQRILAEKIGVGLSTVRRVINKLKGKDLVKTKIGNIYISPKLFFYGNDNMFLAAVKKYDAM